MKKGKKKNGIVVLACLIAALGISIGYAALSTTLNINGTANINPADFNVHFASPSAATLTGEATETTAAALSNENKTLTFEVELAAPGDSATYTVDIVNEGDLDAKIESITVTNNAAKNTDFAFTYVNTATGNVLAENDVITAGQTINTTLKAELPATMTEVQEEAITLTVTINYVQA